MTFLFGSSPRKFFGLPPPPPSPTREDPAIAEARKKLRSSELRRRGRAATILTSGRGVLGAVGVDRPEATAADKLG